MLFLGLLSLFAFLGASESAPVVLTVAYTTTNNNVNTTQLFYITLDDFQKVLNNITELAKAVPKTETRDKLLSAVKNLTEISPVLMKNPKDEVALQEFADSLLPMLQALLQYRTESPSSPLGDLFDRLLKSILTVPPVTTTTKAPVTTKAPTPAPLPDLSTISLQVAQLQNLIPQLTTIANGPDAALAALAKKILDAINKLGTDRNTLDVLLMIIDLALQMAQVSTTNPSVNSFARNILSIAVLALQNLPASSSPLGGLPASLVAILTQLGLNGDIPLNTAYTAIQPLTGAGKTVLANNVAALNTIIAELTKDLTGDLKNTFDTLRNLLTQFGNGTNNVDAILANLAILVRQVLAYTGSDKSRMIALVELILRLLKPLLNTTKATTELQRLIDLLKAGMPTTTTPKPASSPKPTEKPACANNIVGGLLCTVANLLNGLVGNGATDTSTGGNGGGSSTGGLGSILSNLLGGILG